MDVVTTLLRCLKKKHIIDNLERVKDEILIDTMSLRKNEDLFIRDAITGYGTILEENLEQHYYISSFKMGTFASIVTYAIICRSDSETTVAVYAHEGLIRQNLTEKTMQKIKKMLG